MDKQLFYGRCGGAFVKQADGKDNYLRRQLGMLNAVQQQTDAVGRDILPFREDAGELWQIRDISTEMVKADNGNGQS